MVENGKRQRPTGAFQSVQWAAITGASVLVGLLGRHFAAHGDLGAAFTVAALFPLVVLLMATFFVREAHSVTDRAEFAQTWAAVRAALGGRSVWLVATFNLGTSSGQTVGAHLYTGFGEGPPAFRWLVLISTAATAAVWLLVPLVQIERIEAHAMEDARFDGAHHASQP